MFSNIFSTEMMRRCSKIVGTPSHHPFLFWIFHEKKTSSYWGTPFTRSNCGTCGCKCTSLKFTSTFRKSTDWDLLEVISHYSDHSSICAYVCRLPGQIRRPSRPSSPTTLGLCTTRHPHLTADTAEKGKLMGLYLQIQGNQFNRVKRSWKILELRESSIGKISKLNDGF